MSKMWEVSQRRKLCLNHQITFGFNTMDLEMMGGGLSSDDDDDDMIKTR
jgi:hypothetical protein